MNTIEYLLIMWNNTTPHLMGPFESEMDRDSHAGMILLHHGESHGIYKVTVHLPSGEAEVEVFTKAEKEHLVKVRLTAEARFMNYYECPNCKYKWSNKWESQPDDDCPNCGERHITPYRSKDI